MPAKQKAEPVRRVSKVAPGITERLANARKIGVREETITEHLSPSQIDDARARVCSHHREIGKLDTERKEHNAKFKARITELRNQLDESARAAHAGKVDLEIIVEEWITDRNEVIRVRADNQEVIGTRVASMSELQEPMFEDVDEDETEQTANRSTVADTDASHLEVVTADGDFGNGAP